MNYKMNTTLGIALILAVFGLPTVAWAQTTETGDVTAEVQELPISVTQDQALSFGTFMPFGRPGSVTIGVTGNGPTFAHSDVHMVAEGGEARWAVQGVPLAFYEFTHSTSTTLTNGTDTMEVTDIYTHGVEPTLDVNGLDNVQIGGTLSVNANQPPGLYTGTYEVTAVYN